MPKGHPCCPSAGPWPCLPPSPSSLPSRPAPPPPPSGGPARAAGWHVRRDDHAHRARHPARRRRRLGLARLRPRLRDRADVDLQPRRHAADRARPAVALARARRARYDDRVSLDATNLQTDTFFTDLRNRKVVEELLADPVRGPGRPGPRDGARATPPASTATSRTSGDRTASRTTTCRGAGYLQAGRRARPLVRRLRREPARLRRGLHPADRRRLAADADRPRACRSELSCRRRSSRRLAEVSEPPATLPSADELKAGLGKDPSSAFGSNATALGGDATTTGRGMILGNPHFPWHGRYRFAQAHLTIPGEYDVAGASLLGSPVVNIGFNKDVAWSHTVSTAYRFTPYEYRTCRAARRSTSPTTGVKHLEKRVGRGRGEAAPTARSRRSPRTSTAPTRATSSTPRTR